MKNEKHQLKINVTYRKLNIFDTKITYTEAGGNDTRHGQNISSTNGKGLVNGNVLYEVGTGRSNKRNFTYVEVPAGQGEFTWIDYNSNGIPELNEFELAQFQDQAKYIRIFTPTNEFVKANYLQFNYSAVINPRAVIDAAKANAFQKWLARLYFQSSLRVYKRNVRQTQFQSVLRFPCLILL